MKYVKQKKTGSINGINSYFEQKVIILVDEYDVPIQAAYLSNYYTEAIEFMRNLLSGAFKDNNSLHKGMITGILRVARESIFSGLNNLKVESILSYNLSDKFGFTDSEFKKLDPDDEETLEETADIALKQIFDKKYTTTL